MTWLTEDVTTLLIVLGCIELALAFALYQTGRGVVLYIMGGVLLLAGGLFFTERWIVTEKERVEQTLFGVVDCVENNDVDGVLSYVGPDALEVRTLVQSRMKLVEIQEAKITDSPKIIINELTSPPTATASFTGRIQGQLKMGNQYGDTFISGFTITLRRYDGEWKISTVEVESPIPGR